MRVEQQATRRRRARLVMDMVSSNQSAEKEVGDDGRQLVRLSDQREVSVVVNAQGGRRAGVGRKIRALTAGRSGRRCRPAAAGLTGTFREPLAVLTGTSLRQLRGCWKVTCSPDYL